MRSSLLSAASLALALSACAPSLRPITDLGPLPEEMAGGGDEALEESAGPAVAARGPNAARGSAARGRGTRAAAPVRPDATATADRTTVAWDIEVESYASHEGVERYVELFGRRARESTATRLKRGTRYEPFIRAQLREAGMPEDLYYLAFVESGFDAHAYSRAAAVGMWQFMTTTARAVGLQVDWWVDDRRDPVRSTVGAVRHLRDLRRQFDGSLYLAAAAYNGGSGRISRLLGAHEETVAESEGEDRFFALAATGDLRDETTQYVPQLIAVAMIAKQPERFGIAFDSLPPLAYDSVLVPPATPLAAVAEASGASLDEVRELNGRFLRGMTPPSGEEWEVRVPAGLGEGLAERLAGLPDSVRVGVRRVEGKKGDSFAAVAKRHGLTERQLAWYNPDAERDGRGRLRRARTLLVPSRAVVAAALDVADPAVERYSTGSTTAARAPRTHVVQRGESLDRIARRYDLTVARLKALNGLTGDLIRPGQELVVSGEPKRTAAGAGKGSGAKRG